MAFIESQLLTRVAYGFTGGPTWLTTRNELNSGIVARNAERSLPLYVYSAPYRNIQAGHIASVIAAYNACLGGVHSFRFKDHQDYQGTAEVLGLGTGAAGQTLQLVKTYTFGSTSLVRTIKKPVTGTVSLFEDGTPLASTVNTTTGVVTFTATAASPSKTITATYEFDVPVMFTNDDLQFSFNEYNAHTAEINLKEDRSA